MWALWKTALFAVFQVPCGRVLCVRRDGSVHIVSDVAKILMAAAVTMIDSVMMHRASPRGIPQ